MLQDRPAELLRLPGKVAVCFRIQGGQRAKRLPYQHIVIGQVGVAAHVIGGLKEGLVQWDRPVPFGAQGAQNIRKPGADRVVLQTVPVACGSRIALQGQHRGHQFIQLKTRLQDCAVDVPRVDAQVAPLTAEYIVQHPAGQCRVGVHYRRKAPQQAVPVPVSRAHIVARAAAGDQNQLLGIQGDPGGVEQAEEQIGIVEALQLGIRNGPAAGVQPVCGHL